MLHKKRIGIMLYGKTVFERDVFKEDKYKLLAEKLLENNFLVDTINYFDSIAEELFSKLKSYNVILAWVNPIEENMLRQTLDNLLIKIANEGVLVSAHPNTILKIGTKDVLYYTKNLSWGSNVYLYKTYYEFTNGIIASLETFGVRVLKQYRGDGGKGVYKISFDRNISGNFLVTPALKDLPEQSLNQQEFFLQFKSFFEKGNHIIDQEWCDQLRNGMVRCYLTGSKVVGFGYQEIIALYPNNLNDDFAKRQTSKRYYFTEDCGLFKELKLSMEKEWVPDLKNIFAISEKDMPIIWDADFFIENENGQIKYKLCEINASCVSPFPESAITPIILEITRRL